MDYDDSLIKEIFFVHFPDKIVIECQPLSGGLFNKSWLVTLSEQQRVVLRISRKPDMLFRYEKRLFDAERVAYNLCSSNGIKVPRAIIIDDTLDIVDSPLMVSSYIDGVSLHQIKVPTVSKAECFKAAGVEIRRLHSIKGNYFGRIASHLSGISFDTWGDAVVNEAEEWGEMAARTSLFPDDDIERIKKIFYDNISLLNQVKVPHLAHGDLWSGNILSKEENGICVYKGIIDLDRAIFGDPEFDFSGGMMNVYFVDGYGKDLNSDFSSFVRRRLYLLLYSMRQCYVFKHLHNDVENSDIQKKTVYKIKSEFL